MAGTTMTTAPRARCSISISICVAPDGVTLARQPKFFSTEIASNDKLLETFLTLNATLGAFPAGDYTLHYTVHDRAGGKSASFDVPVTLVAAPAG